MKVSLGPESKQTSCQLALFVGAVCSPGQRFLLKVLTKELEEMSMCIAQKWASLVTFYTHHFVASQLIRVNLLSLISLVLLDGENVCDQLYVVIQEDLTNTVDIIESEHPDGKEPLLKNL